MKYLALILISAFLSLSSFATIGPIVGDSAICISPSSPYSFSDTTAGGTWSSSDTLIVTVNSTGVVVGLSAGVATITYTVGAGYQTKTVKVKPAPWPIIGSDYLCYIPIAKSYYDFTPGGGTWDVSIFELDWVSTNGVGISPNGAHLGYVTFTDTAGCSTTKMLTAIDPPLPPITGDSIVNLGSTTVLSSAGSGGTWTSGDTAIATIDPHSGLVTSKSIGSTYVSYEIGCVEYYPMHVTWPASVPVGSTKNTGINVYPNPAQNEVNIKAAFQIINVSISNLIGQTFYSTVCNSEMVKIDVSGLPAGIYFAKVNGTEVRKFVKE
jgi:Secretion system C-terminal sorting domain/Bacterial Ig-like domain (group 2)